jgi:hypothetical protein
MSLNRPEVVQAMERLHDAYEHALTTNDIEALTTFFWDSPHVARYGVAEQLYGAEELRAYRESPRAPVITARRMVRRQIATFDEHCAAVMCEIEVVIGGIARAVRQSQTWVQFPGVGWRIVAAHVSRPLTMAPWESYVDAMSRSLSLPLNAEARAGTIANIERIAAVAAPLLAVPLPDDVEPAAVFRA